MKKTWLRIAMLLVVAGLLLPVAINAQDDMLKEKLKEEKITQKKKQDVQQIIITRKGEKDEKLVVEINGDKITVNGKPLDQLEKNGDLTIRTNKLKDVEFLTRVPNISGNWNLNNDDHMNMFREESNRAMLGVTSEKTDKGVEITGITKESTAAKMGLKEGDIISKVDDKKIESSDDLSATIKAHKPADKVTVTYLRDNKEQKATGELGSWKTQNFKTDMGDMNWEKVMPRVQSIPRVQGSPYGQLFSYNGNTPKLGLSVQDTDDGKGVKVIEVDEESLAGKAGIKVNDLVTDVDGKPINSTDEIVKSMKENKEKLSVMFKVIRSGKTQNVEVKMPRKIQTKDL